MRQALSYEQSKVQNIFDMKSNEVDQISSAFFNMNLLCAMLTVEKSIIED